MSDLQHYYAARASEYDAMYMKPERQRDLRAIEEWVSIVFANAAVLEVACGTGYWTQLIAPTATDVVAIDSAPETIRIAERRVAPAQVEFLVADAFELPRFGRRLESGFAGLSREAARPSVSMTPKATPTRSASSLTAPRTACSRIFHRRANYERAQTGFVGKCGIASGSTSGPLSMWLLCPNPAFNRTRREVASSLVWGVWRRAG